ncbi:hypothetical protein Tco_0747662 [Tanacetum coccineum]|uniref:Uncharacterized protein n=1 Tax=Tanacetum coccineum TaxID=301880 RepID=A0ABQ4YVX0_9ASTR
MLFLPTPIVEMTNDGFQIVGKKKKKGKSKSINGSQIGGHLVSDSNPTPTKGREAASGSTKGRKGPPAL